MRFRVGLQGLREWREINTQAGAWVIVYCPASDTFLLAKRAKTARKPNYWNFFGGHIDEGEAAVDAAARELYEESGIALSSPNVLQIAGRRLFRLAYVNGIRELHYFLLLSRIELTPRLDAEHSQYKWFRRSSLPCKVNRPTAIALSIGVVQKSVVIATRPEECRASLPRDFLWPAFADCDLARS